jgi:WXG100 family type VII secretion target
MTNNVIQVQYETLDHISQRFAQAAENTEHLRAHVTHKSNELLTHGWEGRGASAFANEMDDVLPIVEKLQHALREANQVTLEIARIMREAEEEAASLFLSLPEGMISSIHLNSDGDVVVTSYSPNPPDSRPFPIDYLQNTQAGKQLLEEAKDAKLAFWFPDGTLVGSYDKDAAIVEVKYGEFESENQRGSYSNGDKTITINEDMVSKEDIAGTLVHEMQHALDHKTGKIRYPGLTVEELLEAPKDPDMIQKLEDYYQDRIDSERRAWARGKAVESNSEYRDGDFLDWEFFGYEDWDHYTRKEILKATDGYYENKYEEELREYIPGYEIDLKLDGNGNVQIKFTDPQERNDDWWPFW